MKTQIIGLTGGIGSGKTTIAHHFMSWGVPVYFADDEAKKIMYLQEAAREILETFGDAAFTSGLPDRQKIASLVFNDPAMLSKLNAIIHPKVKEHFISWLSLHSDRPFVIKEAAILFESGSYKDCDGIIMVTAPKEERIQRVMLRDNVTRDKVLERMNNQWEDEKKIAMSNYVIENILPEKAKENAFFIYKIITNGND
ncbi:dephospho-CoA kinase [uncultured Flavobacterium sp.]|uniref:dephospho-CoA kinase n=1 Tax=uncultured Flavobacterium sp. TaxID=165435 RepID=UPI0025D93101|nr:dephospho-CoA kinase [uncultured Flavobacterium sp.]